MLCPIKSSKVGFASTPAAPRLSSVKKFRGCMFAVYCWRGYGAGSRGSSVAPFPVSPTSPFSDRSLSSVSLALSLPLEALQGGLGAKSSCSSFQVQAGGSLTRDPVLSLKLISMRLLTHEKGTNRLCWVLESKVVRSEAHKDSSFATKVWLSASRRTPEGEVVRSEATKDRSFSSKVWRMCLYSADRLPDWNGIHANSFQAPCLVRGGLSVVGQPCCDVHQSLGAFVIVISLESSALLVPSIEC